MTSFEWLAGQVPEGQFLCAIGYESHSIEEWASFDDDGNRQDVCWRCFGVEQRLMRQRAEGEVVTLTERSTGYVSKIARERDTFQEANARLTTALMRACDEGVELEAQVRRLSGWEQGYQQVVQEVDRLRVRLEETREQRDNFGRDLGEVHEYNHQLLDNIQELRLRELALREECARVERLRVGGGVNVGDVWTSTIRKMFDWPSVPTPLDSDVYAQKLMEHELLMAEIKRRKDGGS